MRVLGHIHTFNESDVIDRSIGALLHQTLRVEEVLLVDNASTDGTLAREFPSNVAVVRFDSNRMTSDPIIAAMEYGLKQQYDWVWVLNGDTAPRPDCLQKLMELYEALDPDTRSNTWLLASLPVDVNTGKRDDGFAVTAKGLVQLKPDVRQPYYECDATIWSGSLYKLAAVKEVGLPRSDYMMDMAEIEYGYRGKCRGYKAFVHCESICDHNIGGPSVEHRVYRLGFLSVTLIELKPFRCYYVVRNVLHFWLYEFRGHNLYTYAYCLFKVAKLLASFLSRPFSHWRQVRACIQGIGDGLRKNLEYRYPV